MFLERCKNQVNTYDSHYNAAVGYIEETYLNEKKMFIRSTLKVYSKYSAYLKLLKLF